MRRCALIQPRPSSRMRVGKLSKKPFGIPLPEKGTAARDGRHAHSHRARPIIHASRISTLTVRNKELTRNLQIIKALGTLAIASAYGALRRKQLEVVIITALPVLAKWRQLTSIEHTRHVDRLQPSRLLERIMAAVGVRMKLRHAAWTLISRGSRSFRHGALSDLTRLASAFASALGWLGTTPSCR